MTVLLTRIGDGGRLETLFSSKSSASGPDSILKIQFAGNKLQEHTGKVMLFIHEFENWRLIWEEIYHQIKCGDSVVLQRRSVRRLRSTVWWEDTILTSKPPEGDKSRIEVILSLDEFRRPATTPGYWTSLMEEERHSRVSPSLGRLLCSKGRGTAHFLEENGYICNISSWVRVFRQPARTSTLQKSYQKDIDIGFITYRKFSIQRTPATGRRHYSLAKSRVEMFLIRLSDIRFPSPTRISVSSEIRRNTRLAVSLLRSQSQREASAYWRGEQLLKRVILA